MIVDWTQRLTLESVIQSLSQILLYQHKIKTSTKICLLNNVILPTLMYGLEGTVHLEPHVRRLESFLIRCLRTILGISVREEKRHTTIRKIANSKGSHQFSYNVAFVFLDISQQCPMIAYPSSYLCLPLLVASATLVDRSVVGLMLYLVTSNSVTCWNSGKRKMKSATLGAPSSNVVQSISTRKQKTKEKSLWDDSKQRREQLVKTKSYAL